MHKKESRLEMSPWEGRETTLIGRMPKVGRAVRPLGKRPDEASRHRSVANDRGVSPPEIAPATPEERRGVENPRHSGRIRFTYPPPMINLKDRGIGSVAKKLMSSLCCGEAAW
jgi:hypothetical protein